MKELNVRYGVVNVEERTKYEKENQVSFGYEHLGRSEEKAIRICRKKNNPNWIVEKIYDTYKAKNNRVEIYRSW
jgi:hypothetical protein